MKIEVNIRITEKNGYDWNEIATARVEDSAPWDEIKPTHVRDALGSCVEDALDRIARQVKAEHAKRREAEVVSDD